jgi:hypothetical protein
LQFFMARSFYATTGTETCTRRIHLPPASLFSALFLVCSLVVVGNNNSHHCTTALLSLHDTIPNNSPPTHSPDRQPVYRIEDISYFINLYNLATRSKRKSKRATIWPRRHLHGPLLPLRQPQRQQPRQVRATRLKTPPSCQIATVLYFLERIWNDLPTRCVACMSFVPPAWLFCFSCPRGVFSFWLFFVWRGTFSSLFLQEQDPRRGVKSASATKTHLALDLVSLSSRSS